MSVRSIELHLLTPAELLAAARRVLSAPTCNVQRVSTDEIYTFAVATILFERVSILAGRLLADQATPDERASLAAHLAALGCLPADPAPVTQESP